MGLKEKAISGVLWNTIGKFISYGIEFIVGIILARLLTPEEFGLIGTITVIIVLSLVFINSGFSQAIIRKQKCTQKDYSTVFFFNLAVGIFLFLVLLIAADPISSFFNNPELKPLIQILGIGLIISALTLIQSSILTKRIDFKLQSKISVIASVLSGVIAIAMAYKGYGVWSLVVKSLTQQVFISILLWQWNKWKPDLVFSIESFRELFGFGSKLLLSGLIGTLLKNINYIIIAKYFTPQDLGYFTRAEMFQKVPSENVSSIVTTVGYPVLASIQEDKLRMKEVFRKMFVNTFFIISILMAGMASTAKALVLTLVGNQWLPSVILLQMLSVFGVMLPLSSMNVNVLNVVGRSDLYLKLQLYAQLLIIPNIFIGIFYGIKALIGGMIIIELVSYAIFNHESNKILNYPLKEQLKDIRTSLMLAFLMAAVVLVLGYLITFSPIITLTIQVIAGITFVIGAGEILKLDEYLFLKTTVLNKVRLIKLD